MAQQLGSLEKVLRAGEGRRLKRLQEQAAYIGTLEPEFEKLSDAELAAKTADFRQRVANGESLDDLVFEAFAAVREAFKRTMGVRLFDVQLMGGIVLHEGDIAEMKTGEGKTFVAVQALYLNGLAGRGGHLVTVNDYLAKRDREWTLPVYTALEMKTGFIENMMPFEPRRAAYQADVTYGTNSEFGFDYLRDNMSVSLEGVVQRGHPFGIVDEVDSILVDEARTPLIISGEPETAAKIYYDFARVAGQLVGHRSSPGDPKGHAEQIGADYEFDEKHKTVAVTESGVAKVERALRIDNLYAPQNSQLVNHLIQALKAQSLFQRDVDYVVQEDEVKIVDEFTGRIMEGRRWSEGLHQAVEAKEGVRIQEEHMTMATITLQNYFRLYEKLAGMTGTAKTEEKEFVEIYDLSVVEIPTNVSVARLDKQDLVFKSKDGKFAAVIRDIKERNEKGQPVLVGTIAVETSEYLSQLLTRQGVRHNVLNAKEHAREAEIIKDAGQAGAVTIATNMAGRGVDIKLGDGVRELGGLYVLGTERHESRRIDNQLRGRSGRQGDPGETRFYLSGEDDLVRLFAGDRIKGIMERFKIPEDQPMEAKILSRQIEGAQKKVEEQNFVMRKNVLKYDDVLNRHRGRIYEQRRQVLEGEDMSEQVKLWIDEVVEDTIHQFTQESYAEEWDLEALTNAMSALYQTEITAAELREDLSEISRDSLVEEFQADARDEYAAKEEEFGSELMRELERFVILQVVDVRWREHLENMDYLREGIGLRAMAQKDPLVEYTGEGERMFNDLSRSIRGEVVLHLFHAELAPEQPQELVQQQSGNGNVRYEHETAAGAEAMAAAGGVAPTTLGLSPVAVQTSSPHKVGRNDPCWCGSGKKFKKCHGA
ncbi:MAG TPA: preprotein translocase subunit SecA [Gaiellaceae bacterium]|jgi:preprotein translocase subunit SecA|nr:preprotein translocase subunit SecA [Gaiellaceae bacterium]